MCGNVGGGKPKWSDYQIEDKRTGERFHIVDGERMRNITVFAGKDGVKPLKAAVKEGLAEKYGGEPDRWQHAKGIGLVDYYGEEIEAEIHWFQEETAGRHRFKIKEWHFDEG